MAGRRAGRRLAILIGCLLIVAAGCAVSSSPGTSPSRTIRPSDATSASTGPTSPVVGTVASVDPPAASPAPSPAKATPKPSKGATPRPSPSAKPVTGFTLETTGGTILTFVIGELDNADEFPPASLYDRQASEDPIRVFFTVDGDTLTVTHIEDAG
jgi:hypothetical protein